MRSSSSRRICLPICTSQITTFEWVFWICLLARAKTNKADLLKIQVGKCCCFSLALSVSLSWQIQQQLSTNQLASTEWATVFEERIKNALGDCQVPLSLNRRCHNVWNTTRNRIAVLINIDWVSASEESDWRGRFDLSEFADQGSRISGQCHQQSFGLISCWPANLLAKMATDLMKSPSNLLLCPNFGAID